MKFNNYILILILIFNLLIGCQQVPENLELGPETIELIDENVEETVEVVDKELEKEFDDGLDDTLAELEEIDDI